MQTHSIILFNIDYYTFFFLEVFQTWEKNNMNSTRVVNKYGTLIQRNSFYEFIYMVSRVIFFTQLIIAQNNGI